MGGPDQGPGHSAAAVEFGVSSLGPDHITLQFRKVPLSFGPVLLQVGVPLHHVPLEMCLGCENWTSLPKSLPPHKRDWPWGREQGPGLRSDSFSCQSKSSRKGSFYFHQTCALWSASEQSLPYCFQGRALFLGFIGKSCVCFLITLSQAWVLVVFRTPESRTSGTTSQTTLQIADCRCRIYTLKREVRKRLGPWNMFLEGMGLLGARPLGPLRKPPETQVRNETQFVTPGVGVLLKCSCLAETVGHPGSSHADTCSLRNT